MSEAEPFEDEPEQLLPDPVPYFPEEEEMLEPDPPAQDDER